LLAAESSILAQELRWLDETEIAREIEQFGQYPVVALKVGIYLHPVDTAPFPAKTLLGRIQAVLKRLGSVAPTTLRENDVIRLVLIESILEKARHTTVI